MLKRSAPIPPNQDVPTTHLLNTVLGYGHHVAALGDLLHTPSPPGGTDAAHSLGGCGRCGVGYTGGTVGGAGGTGNTGGTEVQAVQVIQGVPPAFDSLMPG